MKNKKHLSLKLALLVLVCILPTQVFAISPDPLTDLSNYLTSNINTFYNIIRYLFYAVIAFMLIMAAYKFKMDRGGAGFLLSGIGVLVCYGIFEVFF
jgi:hypothetical protein